jgi:hypothetical protein
VARERRLGRRERRKVEVKQKPVVGTRVDSSSLFENQSYFMVAFYQVSAALLCFVLHVSRSVFVSNSSAHESVKFNFVIFHFSVGRQRLEIIKLTGHFDASINPR